MTIPVSIRRFGKQLASEMKLLLVLSICIALAKCDAGYDYSAPRTLVSSQYSSRASLSNHLNQYNVGQETVPVTQGGDLRSSQSQQQQYERIYQQPAPKFSQPLRQRLAEQYIQQYQQPAQKYSQEYLHPQFGQYAQQYSLQQQQVAQVHKHVYVHVAPEEPEPARVRSLPIVAPPQKHYKIIFVKAPSAPVSAQPVLPQQAQSEEKTIVYVLSKKVEEQEQLVLPTPDATAPSKPEVYFIKYKTQKEQLGAVGDVGSGSGQSEQFDGNSVASGINDFESISVESALRANELGRLGGRAQQVAKYGTSKFL